MQIDQDTSFYPLDSKIRLKVSDKRVIIALQTFKVQDSRHR